MSWRLGQRTIARDDRRVHGFCKRYVHAVVCSDVVSQLPYTTQQIEMGVTMEIEVAEIGNGFIGSAGGDLSAPYKTTEALSDLDVRQVRRVQFVVFSKESGLDSRAQGGLQEELQ